MLKKLLGLGTERSGFMITGPPRYNISSWPSLTGHFSECNNIKMIIAENVKIMYYNVLEAVFMITGPLRYKPNNFSWPSLTGHFSKCNNIKMIIGQIRAA